MKMKLMAGKKRRRRYTKGEDSGKNEERKEECRGNKQME